MFCYSLPLFLSQTLNILALLSVDFALVCTEEESSFKQLYGNDSKDELEQDVHDEDVGDVL